MNLIVEATSGQGRGAPSEHNCLQPGARAPRSSSN
jgi:hypothetical protein